MVTTITRLGPAIPSHFAFQVRTGMMEESIHFFELLGWIEVREAIVRDDWGQARFITPDENGNFYIQLTELSGEDPSKLEMTENHLAIHFDSSTPKEAADAIFFWASSSPSTGQDAAIESANKMGTKWFVYIPSLFKFAIEIV